MKNQALFSSKDKSKRLKCRLLQFLFGALRIRSRERVHKLQVSFERASFELGKNFHFIISFKTPFLTGFI